jgi:hypothetical protein
MDNANNALHSPLFQVIKSNVSPRIALVDKYLNKMVTVDNAHYTQDQMLKEEHVSVMHLATATRELTKMVDVKSAIEVIDSVQIKSSVNS